MARETPQAMIARLLGKGIPGPAGAAPAPADPKDIGKEAQSIRLARLLVHK